VKSVHDFVGRDALERFAEMPSRWKVTLSWNSDDVIQDLCVDDSIRKSLQVHGHSGVSLCDVVLRMILQNAAVVGISTYPVYTSNGRRWISLSMIDELQGAPGHRGHGPLG
jgi:vanillate/3-O-methylgallate O-demethylase